MTKENFLKRAFRKLSASNDKVEGGDPQRSVRHVGATQIGDCEDRQLVDLTGTVAAVASHPGSGSPVLEVEIRDRSGAVTLTWLGRREILGVSPGRHIAVSGRICCRNGQRLMYNPRYELLERRPND